VRLPPYREILLASGPVRTEGKALVIPPDTGVWLRR
jgi:hypothetical protein